MRILYTPIHLSTRLTEGLALYMATNRLLRSVLSSRSRSIQILGQAIAQPLCTVMDRAFQERGINWNGRTSCLLLSFDCDFPEDVFALPAILALMHDYEVGGSFASIGRWVSDYPDEHRAVLEHDQEIVNHSFSHPELINAPGRFVSIRDDLTERRWGELTLREKEHEVVECQRVVVETLGYRPRGFRAPHFGNVDPADLYDILQSEHLSYSTSMLASRGEQLGLPVWKGKVLEIPVTTCPRHPFTSLDTWHALYAKGGWHRNDFLSLLQDRLQRSVEFGALTNIYLDPKDLDLAEFERLLSFVAELDDDCWATTYAEFTEWYAIAYPPDDEREAA